MSRRKKCHCKDHKKHDKCGGCKGMDVCTVIPTLLILQSSGLLCNDRAYVLTLLSLLCGGFNNCGCSSNRC